MDDPQRVSDATPQIVQEQFRSFEELDECSAGDVLRLDTTRSLDMQLAEIARAVGPSRSRLAPGLAGGSVVFRCG